MCISSQPDTTCGFLLGGRTTLGKVVLRSRGNAQEDMAVKYGQNNSPCNSRVGGPEEGNLSRAPVCITGRFGHSKSLLYGK